MTYQDIRRARLADPVRCVCKNAEPLPGSDFCADCIARTEAARFYEHVARAECAAHRRKRFVKRAALLVVCLLGYAAAVGFFCPAPFLLLMGIVGTILGVSAAVLLVGAEFGDRN